MKRVSSVLAAGLLCLGVLSCGQEVSAKSYQDVADTAWYHPAVEFVTDAGLIDGVDSNNFAPEQNLTRGEFLLMLGRMAGVDPSPVGFSDFSDVDGNSELSAYACWAVDAKITGGYTNGKFGTYDPISREEMATMMQKYLEASKIIMIPQQTVATLQDATTISTWATESVEMIQKVGLMVGDTRGNFNPVNKIKRSEASAIFMRLMEDIEENQALLGIYEGTYDPNQGLSGVTVNIYESQDGVRASFYGYSLPGMTNCLEGIQVMNVTRTEEGFYFHADAWVLQPTGYIHVDMDLLFDGTSLHSVSGTMGVALEKTGQPVDLNSAEGVYHGTYHSGAIVRQAELDVVYAGDCLEIVFDFFSSSDNVSGSFYLTGYPVGDFYYFVAGDWIEKPSNYVMSDGKLFLDDNVLHGELYPLTSNATPLTIETERVS